MKQHHVAFFNLNALALGLLVNFFAVKGHALFHHVGAKVSRHVQHDAARDKWGYLFYAQLFQPIGLRKLRVFIAVVVHVVNANMAQTVNL